MMNLSRQLPRMALTASALAFALTLSAPGFSAQATKHKHKPAVKKIAARKPAVKPVVKTVLVGPMVGTWTMRDGEKERGDIRVAFRPDGRFTFIGSNFKSEGTYEFVDHVLKLVWTAVDGKAVAPGSMHKDIVMNEADASFTIDRFRYGKGVKR